MNIDVTPLFIHLADRSVWEMENICVKRKCIICEHYWRMGIDLYEP